MWIYDYKSSADNPYKDPPFVKIVHMCYVDALPQWSYPFHQHDDAYEVAWIMTGKGFLTLDDHRIPLQAGSVTAVPPGILHHFEMEPGNDMTYYSLRFLSVPDHSELQTFFRELGTAAAVSTNDLPFIRQTIHMLFSLHQTNGGTVDSTFQSIALGLLQVSRRILSAKTSPVEVDEHTSASEILNYISECSGIGITLESLAKHFAISPSHLSRIFCSAYHVSPINYAITARIIYSTEYLLKTDKPIVEIAELVGYDNPTHFTNMFIKRIGCTPSEFREQNSRMPDSRE